MFELVRPKFAIKEDKVSDLSSSQITLRELYIEVGDFDIKRPEVEKMKRILSQNKKSDSLDVYKDKSISKCHRCEEFNGKVTVIESGFLKKISLCDECLSKVLQNLDSILKYTEENIHYSNDIGLMIYENKIQDMRFNDFIDNETISDETTIALITTRGNVFTKLENINHFITKIEKSEPSEKDECKLCSSESQGIEIKNKHFCDKCSSKIENDLKEFKYNNKELIVSRKI